MMNWLSKKVVSLVLLFAFLGIFIPSGRAVLAQAGLIADFVGGIATFLPAALLFFILQFLVILAGGLAWFSGVILKWVLSPSFTPWSYTNPASNPLIDIGLNITLSFANMILVVFLVVIALSIALGIREYGSKKTFAKLLLVALLINFAPVITGIIVDAANIVMNFFIQGITGGERYANQFKALGESWAGAISWQSFRVTGQLEMILELAVLIFLSVALFLILLLWAVLFMARYVAIWFLVILAPLAFACFILPATKRIWSLWWDQFTKWVLVGVNAVFFLWLADQFAIANPTVPPSGTLGGSVLTGLFPIVVYWVGFIISLGKLPAEAAAIKGLTTKYGKVALIAGAGAAYSRAIGSRWAERRGLKEKLESQAGAKFMPERVRQMGRTAQVAYAVTAGAPIWALRRGVGEAALRATESGKDDITKAEGEYKGTVAERKLAAMRDVRLGWGHRVGALRAAIEDEEIGDLTRLGATPEEITRIGRAALRAHPDMFKKIRDTFPDLAETIGQGFSESIQKQAKIHHATAQNEGYSGVIEKIMKEMRPSEATKMDSGLLFGPRQNRIVWESAQKHWGGSHWAQTGEEFGRKFAEYVGNEFQKAPGNFSKAAQKYFTSSPAGQSLYGT